MKYDKPDKKTSSTPLTIIAGFLGSGKTSLLNHLLTHADGRRITALVNDFGALNIDSELIAAQHGNQISLANGCVCCSIGDDLTLALAQIMGSEIAPTSRPDHILIEASGVADPSRIAAFAAVDKDLRLDSIITLVDAAAHEKHANDPYLSDNYARQIKAADLLLLNKIDLSAPNIAAHLAQELAKQNKPVPIIPLTFGALDIDLALSPQLSLQLSPQKSPQEKLPRPVSPAPPAHVNIRHLANMRHWSAHLPASQNRTALAEKIASLQPYALRAKGIFEDTAGTYVIHLAGGRISFDAFNGAASGHFVVIGKPDLPSNTALAQLFGATNEKAT